MRKLAIVLILCAFASVASAQSFDPTVYEWKHTRIADDTLSDGMSVLEYTLTLYNTAGWEVFGPPQRIETGNRLTTPTTDPVYVAGSTLSGSTHAYDVVFRRPKGWSTPAPVASQPAPQTTCTSVKPGPDWRCVNGGWLPPK